ncbi:MAG: hypothetical protein A2Y63_05905 [Candidatus Riflebacteria bacterium RBG_13_59_9]|nr:MAG: hypothetical protein A2Y63_05905 [Candidatus Riflebacteria bacterium RBG_13_59_9]
MVTLEKRALCALLVLAALAVGCSSKPTLRDEIAQEDLNLGLSLGAAVDEQTARSALESLDSRVEPYQAPRQAKGSPDLHSFRVGDALDICLLVGADGLLSGIAVMPVFEIKTDLPPGLTDVTWDKFNKEVIAAARSEKVQRFDLATKRGVGLGSGRLKVLAEYGPPDDETNSSGASYMVYGDEDMGIRFMLLNSVVATIQIGNRSLYRSVHDEFPSFILALG